MAVIGAGMAGITAAHALAAAGAAVAILEAEASPGTHATGRSAALFDENYGNDVVRRLTAASRRSLEGTPSADGTPLLRRRGTLRVAAAGDDEALDAGSAPPGRPVRRLDAPGAVDLCPILSPTAIAGALWDPSAADIDVDAMLQAYLRQGRALGASVLTGCRLVDASLGHRWSLTTTDGKMEAGTVVDAAGAWADDVAVLCGARPLGLQPLRRTAFLFDPPGGADPSAWPMVIDVNERYYFKPEAGRLLGSPADETPVPAGDARPEEIDVASALERIGEVLGTELRHAHRPWAGLRTFAPDRTPVVGEDPDVDGFYWLAGQGGYGIQAAPAMAAMLASIVTGQVLPSDLTERGLTTSMLDPVRLRHADPT